MHSLCEREMPFIIAIFIASFCQLRHTNNNKEVLSRGPAIVCTNGQPMPTDERGFPIDCDQKTIDCVSFVLHGRNRKDNFCSGW